MKLLTLQERIEMVKYYDEYSTSPFAKLEGPGTCYGCRSCQYIKSLNDMKAYDNSVRLVDIKKGETIIKCNYNSKKNGILYLSEDAGCDKWTASDSLLKTLYPLVYDNEIFEYINTQDDLRYVKQKTIDEHIAGINSIPFSTKQEVIDVLLQKHDKLSKLELPYKNQITLDIIPFITKINNNIKFKFVSDGSWLKYTLRAFARLRNITKPDDGLWIEMSRDDHYSKNPEVFGITFKEYDEFLEDINNHAKILFIHLDF